MGTDLDERVAEDGSGNVTDPHTREARYAHVRKQDGLGLRTGETEDLGREDFVDVLLREGGGEGESTEEEHDSG